jgi:hypothetical protein
LSAEASRALEDFGLFQRRYFGRIATPWQEEAAHRIVELIDTPDKEFAVVNAPPGSGKSTTFTLDIPAFVTCRNRAVRGLIGSKVEGSAQKYVLRLRRAFERTVPVQAESEDRDRGLAVDAVATLADDFGRFKPEKSDLWSAQGFVVEQPGGVMIDEKEPTWSAFGMDSGFLGMRYDLVIWDDLVDRLVMRTAEGREKQQEWWDDIAEKRLEPGGLLVLQGQRMGPDDLYRYALDKRVRPDDDDPDEDTGVAGEGAPKYHHIVFKAHNDERCRGRDTHRRDAPYYPDGCLLDPRRLPWRELRSEMSNPRNNFQVIYQQEDVDPANVLVDPLWVRGGVDPKTGEVFAGCMDRDRGECEVPHGLFGQLVSYATADPSPTRFWSVQWWVCRVVDGMPQERYLLDHIRQQMDAPSFLDWRESERRFTGVMEDWQQRSVDLGMPIGTWIVEANAAQRFMLQYEHVRRWQARWRVDIRPHQTGRNKSDPEFGVQTIGPIFKYGLVRLPMRSGTAGALGSLKLIEEVTHWPEWSTDDTVMAMWFGEFCLPSLIPPAAELPLAKRPSWMGPTWKGVHATSGAAVYAGR